MNTFAHPTPNGLGTTDRPGPRLPDLRAFPLGRWVSALRSVASSLPYTELGYPDATGHPRLRQVLAEYLTRVRAPWPTRPT
jgi:DNA-binding transcriptional MocR family regulator